MLVRLVMVLVMVFVVVIMGMSVFMMMPMVVVMVVVCVRMGMGMGCRIAHGSLHPLLGSSREIGDRHCRGVAASTGSAHETVSTSMLLILSSSPEIRSSRQEPQVQRP